MKALHKLSTIYIIGLGFLVITILVALLSFFDIYTSTGKILKTTTSLATKQTGLPLSDSAEFLQSIAEIESIRVRAYFFFSGALALSLAGILLIFYIYKKNIVEPLHHIESATRKMAQGRFEKLPVRGGTEIGTLAENFNSMGQTLRDKIRELEEAVRREQSVVRKLNILNELTSAITLKLNVDEVLESLISFSTPLIKSEINAIVLIDRLSRQVTHFFSSLPEDRGNITTLVNNIISELILSKGMPMRLSVSSREKRFTNITEGTSIEINNFMAVPILIEKEIRGALILANKTGANDFTMEDEDTALIVSFQAAVAIEKALLHEETVQLAKTDGLTGLNNHRTFHENLDFELKRVRRFKRYLSLLLIDIDYFKKFNDTYGHQAGDAVLKELAGIFRQNLRSIDYAARYGGEEFTIILPETSRDDGVKTAERIRNAVDVHSFDIAGNKSHITVSIGVAVFPNDAMDKGGLIKAADDAQYMAKRKGGNKIVTFQQYKVETTRTKL